MAVVSLVLITTYTATKNELTQIHTVKSKILCEKNLSNCNKKLAPRVPKGVCAPGGKCT